MNNGTPLGVRVQEAFMAAVLIDPTTKTNKQSILSEFCLHNIQKLVRLFLNSSSQMLRVQFSNILWTLPL
jgi:hypothetical protein